MGCCCYILMEKTLTFQNKLEYLSRIAYGVYTQCYV